jgi:hypothetical protein
VLNKYALPLVSGHTNYIHTCAFAHDNGMLLMSKAALGKHGCKINKKQHMFC